MGWNNPAMRWKELERRLVALATEATVRAYGHEMTDVLPVGAELEVRRTANLHTGGTIHAVTDRLQLTEALTSSASILSDVVGALADRSRRPHRSEHHRRARPWYHRARAGGRPRSAGRRS